MFLADLINCDQCSLLVAVIAFVVIIIVCFTIHFRTTGMCFSVFGHIWLSANKVQV